MCGLVGVAGNLFTKDVSAFKELLIVDQLRGYDSTGIGVVPKDDKAAMRIYKQVVSPAELLQFKPVDTNVNTFAKALIGHNRAATRGKVNRSNAHPFLHGQIMGAHNGTLDHACLYGANALAANIEGDTDSERLIREIDQSGVVAALAKTVGAWALAYYNDEDNTINLVRNDKRPLFFARAADGDTLWWASEAGMLHWILTRNQIDFNKKIFSLPENVVHTWAIPTKSSEMFTEKPTKTNAPGKSVQNFPNVAPINQRSSAPVGCHAANGGRSNGLFSDSYSPQTRIGFKSFRPRDYHYSPEDINLMRTSPYNDVQWEIYGLAWNDFDHGIYQNPFYAHTYPEHHKEYNLAWEGAQETAGKKPKEPKKPEVILVGELKKDIPKQSTIHRIRTGPDGKRLTPSKWREMTGCKCGWCDKPVKDDDNGKFLKVQGFPDDFYVGECCTSDPNIMEEVSKEQAVEKKEA